jgi:hypothetical protein
MKVKTLFIVFFLFGINLFAQQFGFEKSYQFLTNEEAAKSCIEDEDGGFVIGIGPRGGSASYLRDYGLIKLNTWGDTVWHTTFFLNYYTTLQLVKKAPDKGYLTIGVADDTVGSTHNMLFIGKFDSVGNLNWVRFYSNPQQYFVEEFISAEFVNGDSLFICTGASQFILLDSAYNIIKKKFYQNFLPSGGSLQKEKSLNFQGNYYYYRYYKPLWSGPYTLRILAIDMNGDSVFSKQIPNDTLGFGRIIKISNSYFLAIGYKLIGSPPATYFISKIDTSGVMLWSKPIALPLANSNYYNFISYATMLNGNNVVSFIPTGNAPIKQSYIYCFDDNGDSLWAKSYKNDSLSETSILDIIATSDSGLLACGQIKEPGGAIKNYIVKTNSNGVILNAVTELAKKNEAHLHVYPNPATSYTSIHYLGLEKNAMLNLHNLHGQLIYSAPINNNEVRIYISTEKLNPGIYLCNIIANDRVLFTKKLVVIKE